MKYQSIRQAAATLDVSYQWLARKARAGKISYISYGHRKLVDVDDLAQQVEKCKQLVKMSEVIKETGLSERFIRRGVQNEQIPCQRVLGSLYFDLDAVKEALADMANHAEQTEG